MDSCKTIYRGELYSVSLVLSTGWNSSSHKKYAIANGWANGLPSSGKAYTVQSGTMCVINGTSLEVASVYKTSSTGTLTLYTASGGSYDFSLTHTNVEGESQGWYWISGTLKLISEQRGIVAETLIPANSAADCGTASQPFDSGYFGQIATSKIILNDQELVVGSDGIVRVDT